MNKPHPVEIIVGNNLRIFRNKKGLSQQELGKQLGVTCQQVQKYEKGINRIAASRLYNLAEILNMSIESFYRGLDTGDVSPDLMTKEACELIRDYSRIKDPSKRRVAKRIIIALGG